MQSFTTLFVLLATSGSGMRRHTLPQRASDNALDVGMLARRSPSPVSSLVGIVLALDPLTGYNVGVAPLATTRPSVFSKKQQTWQRLPTIAMGISGNVPVTRSTLDRRSFGALAAAAAGATLLSATPAFSEDDGAWKNKLADLGKKAKILRQQSRVKQAKAKDILVQGTETVLKPLQTLMFEQAQALKIAPAEEQANFMVGHMAELAYALKQNQLTEYKSKTTKDFYPGGKAERELEEISDTFDDYIKELKKAGITGLKN